MLPLERLVDHPFPIPALDVVVEDVFLKRDRGTELGDVEGEGEEEPLAEAGDVVLGREVGEEDAEGVCGGEEVEEEEIVFGGLFLLVRW